MKLIHQMFWADFHGCCTFNTIKSMLRFHLKTGMHPSKSRISIGTLERIRILSNFRRDPFGFYMFTAAKKPRFVGFPIQNKNYIENTYFDRHNATHNSLHSEWQWFVYFFGQMFVVFAHSPSLQKEWQWFMCFEIDFADLWER